MKKLDITPILDDEPFRSNLEKSLNAMIVPDKFILDNILVCFTEKRIHSPDVSYKTPYIFIDIIGKTKIYKEVFISLYTDYILKDDYDINMNIILPLQNKINKAIKKDIHNQQILYTIREILDSDKEYQDILKTNIKQPILEKIPIWNYELNIPSLIPFIGKDLATQFFFIVEDPHCIYYDYYNAYYGN